MSKTILITGSTDGIGKLAAFKLAQDGHTIIVHGRNENKVDALVSEIKATAKNPNISGYTADFSDLGAVDNMAKAIQQDIRKIDVLINNAGVFKSAVSKTKEGLDMRIVVNYLAPYVLTKAVLSLLKASDAPRIINLSSAAQSTVTPGVLNGQVSINVSEAYAQSKLALTMWSFDLAKKNETISVIAVNPGSLLNTRMVSEAYGQHWAPADKGANILYELAVSEVYEGVSGKYFNNDKGDPKGEFSPAHPDTYDEAKIEALIVATEYILGN